MNFQVAINFQVHVYKVYSYALYLQWKMYALLWLLAKDMVT